ncbi:MAG: hypothetical protein ACH37Z_12360 [Anaerolineae bacterium]
MSVTTGDKAKVVRLFKAAGTALVHNRTGRCGMEPALAAEIEEAREGVFAMFEAERIRLEAKIAEENEKLEKVKEDLDGLRTVWLEPPTKQLRLPFAEPEAPKQDRYDEEGLTQQGGGLIGCQDLDDARGEYRVYESNGEGGLAESPEPVPQPVDPTLPPVEVEMPEDPGPLESEKKAAADKMSEALLEKLLEKAGAGHSKTISCKLVQQELSIKTLAEVQGWWDLLIARGSEEPLTRAGLRKQGRRVAVVRPEVASEPAPPSESEDAARPKLHGRPMEMEELLLIACEEGAENSVEAQQWALTEMNLPSTKEEADVIPLLEKLWKKLIASGAILWEQRDGGNYVTRWEKLAGPAQRATILELHAGGEPITDLGRIVGVPFKTVQAVLHQVPAGVES